MVLMNKLFKILQFFLLCFALTVTHSLYSKIMFSCIMPLNVWMYLFIDRTINFSHSVILFGINIFYTLRISPYFFNSYDLRVRICVYLFTLSIAYFETYIVSIRHSYKVFVTCDVAHLFGSLKMIFKLKSLIRLSIVWFCRSYWIDQTVFKRKNLFQLQIS